MIPMNRRALIKAAVVPWTIAALPAGAQAPAVVDVVKVMSFSCSFCFAAEAQDPLIEREVVRRGGRFVRAPIAETAVASGYRERAYYASRELGVEFSEQVKRSLYRGTQEAQVQLQSYPQVYYWLLQDMPQKEDRLVKLIELAQRPEAGEALLRAGRLTVRAGVQRLPTYVLLVDGQVVASLDSTTTGATSMAALREAVLSRIEKI